MKLGREVVSRRRFLRWGATGAVIGGAHALITHDAARAMNPDDGGFIGGFATVVQATSGPTALVMVGGGQIVAKIDGFPDEWILREGDVVAVNAGAVLVPWVTTSEQERRLVFETVNVNANRNRMIAEYVL